jgi:hypothetical protein
VDHREEAAVAVVVEEAAGGEARARRVETLLDLLPRDPEQEIGAEDAPRAVEDGQAVAGGRLEAHVEALEQTRGLRQRARVERRGHEVAVLEGRLVAPHGRLQVRGERGVRRHDDAGRHLEEAVAARVLAGEDRAEARPRERRLREGVLEHDAARGERVDLGRLHARVPVAAEDVLPHRVDHDEEDVREVARALVRHAARSERADLEEEEQASAEERPRPRGPPRRVSRAPARARRPPRGTRAAAAATASIPALASRRGVESDERP